MGGDTAAAVSANDYFEIHSRSSHTKRFVQEKAGEVEAESTGYCRVLRSEVVRGVVQQRLPTMPNNLAVRAGEEEEVREATEVAEA